MLTIRTSNADTNRPAFAERRCITSGHLRTQISSIGQEVFGQPDLLSVVDCLRYCQDQSPDLQYDPRDSPLLTIRTLERAERAEPKLLVQDQVQEIPDSQAIV